MCEEKTCQVHTVPPKSSTENYFTKGIGGWGKVKNGGFCFCFLKDTLLVLRPLKGLAGRPAIPWLANTLNAKLNSLSPRERKEQQLDLVRGLVIQSPFVPFWPFVSDYTTT